MIELAKITDLDALYNNLLTSWPDWFDANENSYICKDYLEKQILNNYVFIIKQDDKIVAHLIFNIHWIHLHIDDIFVDESMRRKGIATKLYNYIFEYAKLKKIKDILSDCDNTNIESIQLHLKTGFLLNGYLDDLWGDGISSVTFLKKI